MTIAEKDRAKLLNAIDEGLSSDDIELGIKTIDNLYNVLAETIVLKNEWKKVSNEWHKRADTALSIIEKMTEIYCACEETDVLSCDWHDVLSRLPEVIENKKRVEAQL